MNLTLKRRFRGTEYTIGSLYIDGEYFCDTLEDVDRGLSQDMKESEIIRKKIKNETAIPTGTYEVSLKYKSTKFKDHCWAKPYKGIVPRIMNVKGYEGVLIHPGNTKDNTSGCVLVGENKEKGKVLNSAFTYHKLMAFLQNSSDKIILNII